MLCLVRGLSPTSIERFHCASLQAWRHPAQFSLMRLLLDLYIRDLQVGIRLVPLLAQMLED